MIVKGMTKKKCHIEVEFNPKTGDVTYKNEHTKVKAIFGLIVLIVWFLFAHDLGLI